MFIAYLGVDKSEYGGRRTSLCLLKKLKKRISWRYSNCKGVFCELQSPNAVDDSKELSERKARIKLFRDLIKKIGLFPYEIDVVYRQPEFPNQFNESTKEEELILLYAQFKESRNNQIGKSDFLKGLHFIFFKIYLPTYRNDHEMYELYKSYLNEKYNLYVTTIPLKVKLI